MHTNQRANRAWLLKSSTQKTNNSNSISKVKREGKRGGQTTGLTKRHWKQSGEEPRSDAENAVSVEANVSKANVKQSGRNYKVIRMKWDWNNMDKEIDA